LEKEYEELLKKYDTAKRFKVERISAKIEFLEKRNRKLQSKLDLLSTIGEDDD